LDNGWIKSELSLDLNFLQRHALGDMNIRMIANFIAISA